MVSLKLRAAVLGGVTLATLAVMTFWEKPSGYENIDVPSPNWIGSTWYGPVLLVAIPLCLAWLSWGVRNEFVKGIGLVVSLLVGCASVFLITLGNRVAMGWM